MPATAETLIAQTTPPGAEAVQTPEPQTPAVDPSTVLNGGSDQAQTPVIPPLFQQQYAQAARAAQEAQARADALEVYTVANWLNQFEAGTPERAQAEAQANTWYVQKQAQARIAQEQAARREMEEALTPLLQDAIYTRLSTQHGIPKEVLQQYGKTPEQVKAVVESWSHLKKLGAFEKRVEAKLDSAPASAGSQSDPSGRHDEVREQFRGTGNIQGYLKALRARS